MAERNIICRNATTFTKAGEIDREGYRQLMERFVAAGVGVAMGTAGSGESHALSQSELGELYRIGVEVCRGKVAVHANPPEQHTPKAAIEQSLVAAKAGVDTVNLYGPTGWHGYKPTDAEFLDFFDEVLPNVKHPVALNPNGVIGYVPKPALVAQICKKYTQVAAINFATEGDIYFIDLKDRLTRDLELNVNFAGCSGLFPLGATGVLTAEATIIPRTYRAYLDHFEKGETEAMNTIYRNCLRFSQFVRAWSPSNARWLKMAMRVLKLPGGEGGPRSPYRLPPEEEIARFTKGLLALRIPEIDDLARAAGLDPTS